MSLPAGVRRLLRLESVDRDLEEELACHFAHTVEELVAQGHPREAAEREARRRFGHRASYVRELQSIDRARARRLHWRERLDAMRDSVRQAARALSRAPVLALGIVLTFALGIGANATMYDIVNRLLISAPPHVQDGANARRLYTESYAAHLGKRFASSTFSYPEFGEMRAVKAFQSVAGYSQRDVIVGQGESAQEVSSMWASGGYFELLGVRPELGRFYDAREDRVGGPRLAVLSHGYWQRQFAGARNALGQTIDFGNGPYTIVGVAPRGFTGAELQRVDFWVPLHVAATDVQGSDWSNDRGFGWFQVIARLAPGVAPVRAAAEASALHAAGWSDAIARGEYNRDPAILVAPIQTALGPDPRAEALVARLLLAVSLVVLVIACVNVANLMLARTIAQGREFAVRLALGVSRARLIGQVLLEGVLLATAGGVAALALYRWGGALIRRTLLPEVAWEDAGLTAGLVLVVLGMALLAGVLSAAIPAWKAARGELSVMLRRATAGAITRTTARTRTLLALAQTALSVLLLVGAGLFVRSLDRVQHLDLGFEVEGMYRLTPRVVPNSMTAHERIQMYQQAEQRLARVPGITSVGLAASFPFHSRRSVSLRAQDVDSIRRPPTGGPYVHDVSPGYFKALGLRVLRGRSLLPTDTRNSPRVALLNQSLARWLYPDQNAIGKCLYVGLNQTRCSEIVGIVEDAAQLAVGQDMPLQYYLPIAQGQTDSIARMIVARAEREDAATARALQRELTALDPRIRFSNIETMRDRLAPETRSWTLGATMFAAFGLLALLVASLGLYSVLAFDVTQRTRELGVRAALGASRQRLLRMVIARALQVTAAGVGVGLLAALALGNRVAPLLFQISPRDPLTLGGVALLLLAVATASAVLPGARAARVDPNRALRAD